MKSRLLAVFWAGTAGLLGCSSDPAPHHHPSGGAPGTAGASNPSAGASGSGASDASGAGASGASSGPAASACPEQPTPLRTLGTVLSLPLRLVLAGKPFVFGQPNALADGGSLLPLNLRFYISEVQLLRGGGEEPIAVDLVTVAGAPEPYGLHFFNAEEADSSTLRVLAPPGEYAGLSFLVGIKLGCNQQRPSTLSEPLTDVSQMTWPHPGGFLFLRYEGRYTASDSAGSAGASSNADFPPAIHMGGNVVDELVPRVMVSSSSVLSIPASGSLERGLNVVMDEIFQGASSNVDVSGMPGLSPAADSIAGERLRRRLPDLHVFELEP
jgi:hypothetical protein